MVIVALRVYTCSKGAKGEMGKHSCYNLKCKTTDSRSKGLGFSVCGGSSSGRRRSGRRRRRSSSSSNNDDYFHYDDYKHHYDDDVCYYCYYDDDDDRDCNGNSRVELAAAVLVCKCKTSSRRQRYRESPPSGHIMMLEESPSCLMKPALRHMRMGRIFETCRQP